MERIRIRQEQNPEDEEFKDLNTPEVKTRLEAEQKTKDELEAEQKARYELDEMLKGVREEFNKKLEELDKRITERENALEDRIAKLEKQVINTATKTEEENSSEIAIPEIEAREEFIEASKEYPFLAPNHNVGEVGGANIFISDIMSYGPRDVALVYTKMEEKDSMKPHLFYRSRSSALWRLAPWQREDGWIFKSNYGEDAINAPIELQKKMSELADEQQDKTEINMRGLLNLIDDPEIPKDHHGNISKFVSERKVNGKDSLTPPFEYIGEVQNGYRYELPDPEECVLSEQESPDYDRELYSWTVDNDMYGKLTAHCFESKDKSLRYLIFKNHEGRAWIGAVEPADSKLSQLGINKEFVQPGAIATPLYEYHHNGGTLQDGRKGGGYWGNPNDRKDVYTGMDNYLNRIPALQEFNQRYKNK